MSCSSPLRSTAPVRRSLSTVAVACFLLVGCSDHQVTGKVVVDDRSGTDTGASASGSIGVTPSGVEVAGVCGREEAEVVLRNTGDAVLTVDGAEVDGSGWTLDAPPVWPASIEPGEALTLTVSGSDGEATLWIRSDDPEQGTVGIPLVAAANLGPELLVEAPVASEILDEGADVTLTAVVTDPDAPVDGLVVTWSSDIDGELGTATTDASGRAELVWSGSDRGVGSHVVTAATADVCGATDTVDLGVCQQGDVGTAAPGYGSWQLDGDASWDTTSDWLQLTSSASYVAGAAFDESTTLNGGNLSVSFDFKVGGGSGGDGFALVALDRDRMSGILGRAGGCLGHSGDAGCPGEGASLPGWALEFDILANSFDPTTSDHLEVVFDGDLNTLNVWGTLPELQDTGWHSATVTVADAHFTVVIDGVTYLDRDVTGDLDFPAMMGFTAGNGWRSNFHLIDNVSYSAPACAAE